MAYRIWSPDLTIVLTKLDRMSAGLPEAASRATRALAELILWESDNVPPVVPVDTGDLRSTGHVEKIEGAKPVQYAVVYGGSTGRGTFVDYADKVHDDLRARKYKRAGSGPKFVEAHVDSHGIEIHERFMTGYTSSFFRL